MCPFIRVDILKSRLFAPVTRRVIVSAISSEKMSWLQELGDWLVLDMVFWNLDSTTNSEILKYITGDWSRESHRRTDSEFANQTRNASSSRAIYYARQKKESRHPRTSRRKNQAESENEKLNSYKNPEHSFLEETQSNRHCRVSTVWNRNLSLFFWLISQWWDIFYFWNESSWKLRHFFEMEIAGTKLWKFCDIVKSFLIDL